MNRPYIVIDAPGHYGDEGGLVYSSHATFGAARRAAQGLRRRDVNGLWSYPVIVAHNEYSDSDRRGRYAKGSTFYRDMPPTPVA